VNEIKMYRTKLGRVGAIHHDSVSALSADETAEFCGGRVVKNEHDHGSRVIVDSGQVAEVGDWVIRTGPVTDEGTERYLVCPPTLFEALFEADS
jgi:hypothetical protein